MTISEVLGIAGRNGVKAGAKPRFFQEPGDTSLLTVSGIGCICLVIPLIWTALMLIMPISHGKRSFFLTASSSLRSSFLRQRTV